MQDLESNKKKQNTKGTKGAETHKENEQKFVVTLASWRICMIR